MFLKYKAFSHKTKDIFRGEQYISARPFYHTKQMSIPKIKRDHSKYFKTTLRGKFGYGKLKIT